jgi:O-antigen/teichoic acid export membrane protein
MDENSENSPGEGAAASRKAGITGYIVRRFLRGGAWVLICRLVWAPVALAISTLLTRILTPSEVGTFYFALTLMTILAFVLHVGLPNALVKFVATGDHGNGGRARAAIIACVTYGSLIALPVAIAIGFGGLDFILVRIAPQSSLLGYGWILAFWILTLVCQGYLSESYRGFHEIGKTQIFGGLAGRGGLALFLLVVWVTDAQAELVHVLIAAAATLLIADLVGGAMLSRKVARLSRNGTIGRREIFATSWPLMIGSVFYTLNMQAGTLVLGLFRPEDEVGLFAIAMRLAALANLPMVIVIAVAPPLVAELYAKGETKALEKMLGLVSFLAVMISLVLTLVFVFAGGDILAWIFGATYREAKWILVILSLGYLGHALMGPGRAALEMTGHQRYAMWATVIAGVAGIVALFSVTAAYGALAVAAVSAGTIFLQHGIMNMLARRHCKINTTARISFGLFSK